VRVALAVTTDGRGDCLHQAIDSLRVSLRPWPRWRVMVDDSGDRTYTAMLRQRYTDFEILAHEERRGFAATVESVWRLALQAPCDYVFHAEDDFTYREPVDLDGMARLLEDHPRLAQLALKRQPINEEERAAGGFMQTRPPETWTAREGFVEHSLNFTTNPCLIPREFIESCLAGDWPKSEPAISRFAESLPRWFAYLGAVGDGPRVEHIGHERTAGWMQ
jgi:GT2 family glycosyltransferase